MDIKFWRKLAKSKIPFDNLIIRNSLETTNRRKEGEWFLNKAYREDKNERARGYLYVQTRFHKNSFAKNNHEILTNGYLRLKRYVRIRAIKSYKIKTGFFCASFSESKITLPFTNTCEHIFSLCARYVY